MCTAEYFLSFQFSLTAARRIAQKGTHKDRFELIHRERWVFSPK